MASTWEQVNPANNQFMDSGWGDNNQGFMDYTKSMMDFGTFTGEGGIGQSLIDMAMGAGSSYAQATDAWAAGASEKAARTSMNAFSGENALYSSGSVGAATMAAGDINLQAQKEKTAMSTTMVSQLLNSGLSAFSQNQNALLAVAGDMATPVLKEKQNPWVTGLELGISAVGAVSGLGGGGGLMDMITKLMNGNSLRPGAGQTDPFNYNRT